jgi:hypothetical protein
MPLRKKFWLTRHETDMQTRLSNEQGVTDVVAWRRDQLVATGFPRSLAERIAGDSGYDLHTLMELVEAGCKPALAARILAPDDGNA